MAKSKEMASSTLFVRSSTYGGSGSAAQYKFSKTPGGSSSYESTDTYGGSGSADQYKCSKTPGGSSGTSVHASRVASTTVSSLGSYPVVTSGARITQTSQNVDY